MEKMQLVLSILASVLSIISVLWTWNLSNKVKVNNRGDRNITNLGDNNVNNTGNNNKF